MAKQGYIKLHRQIQECWIWNEDEFSRGQAWIDLLLSCNHEDKKIPFEGKPYVVQRGEWLTSILGLSVRWKWGRKKVSNFLDTLEKDGMIVQNRNNKRTLIKVVNYEAYQSFDTCTGTAEEHQTNINGTSSEHQRNTNNNDKNDKECIKNDKEIKHIYGEYKKVRLTEKEFEKLCKDYGKEKTLKAIKKLDEYKEMKGVTYKSDNLALRNWGFNSVDDEERKKNKNLNQNNNQYANDKQAQKLNIIFNGGIPQ